MAHILIRSCLERGTKMCCLCTDLLAIVAVVTTVPVVVLLLLLLFKACAIFCVIGAAVDTLVFFHALLL